MRPSRIIALVVGCLLLLPGIGLLLGGGGLAIGYAFQRNDDGYFAVPLTEVASSTAAITAGDVALTADTAGSAWFIDFLDTDVRLRITPTDTDTGMFVGVGPATDVGDYLNGVARDEVTGVDGGAPTYLNRSGDGTARPPQSETFWIESAAGVGTQQIDWQVTDGRWAVVIMHQDATSGISASAAVEVRAGFLLPLAFIVFGLGVLVTAGAIVLIVVGAAGRRRGLSRSGDHRGDGTWAPHPYGSVPAFAGDGTASAERPVALTGRLDPQLSRWTWLVKWVLAFPHYVVLALLWPAFVVVTVIAGVSILFTGVYPRGLFEFNAGVLRWSWRVSFYAFNGGIGTDRYPPFSLGHEPDYPATLDIAYPVQLSRGLVLVKWWLLAIPHYIIVGLMVGNWFGWSNVGRDRFALGPIGGFGILGLLVVVAGAVLLFSGRYPRPLFDLILGMNRWIYRVIAYAALMTDTYPPFRLDQGGSEPIVPPPFPSAGPKSPTLPEPVGSRY